MQTYILDQWKHVLLQYILLVQILPSRAPLPCVFSDPFFPLCASVNLIISFLAPFYLAG